MRSESEVKFYSPVDIAGRYQVQLETVWRWLRLGKLPAKKLAGGRYYISEADLEAFEAKYSNI